MYKPRPAAYLALLLYPALFRALPWLLDRGLGIDISSVAGPFFWGLTPVFALGMFSTAHFKNKAEGLVLPLVGWLIGDLLIRAVNNDWGFFYPGWHYTYLAFAVVCLAGYLLRRGYQLPQALGVSVLGSVLFFLVSNFGSWSYYTPTWQGLLECYLAGLPFLKWQLPSTLLFTALLFSPLGRQHLLMANETESQPKLTERQLLA